MKHKLFLKNDLKILYKDQAFDVISASDIFYEEIDLSDGIFVHMIYGKSIDPSLCFKYKNGDIVNVGTVFVLYNKMYKPFWGHNFTPPPLSYYREQKLKDLLNET